MYITGKEAQFILEITTRQGLHKIVKENSITTKTQGVGKPNLYLKDDVLKAKEARTKTEKYKPQKIVKKVQKQKKQIEENKEKIKEVQKKQKEVQENKKDKNFTLLDKTGEDEFNRIIDLLTQRGTYKEEDRGLALSYAVNYQKWANAVVSSAEYADIATDDHGNQKIHPYFGIAKQCQDNMIKIANQLGIGARARIGLDIKKKKVSFADAFATKAK